MLLELTNLSKEYPCGGKSFFAVRDVCLSLDAGDFAIIAGRSGSGKTTLLSLIGGLLIPSSGKVVFDGCDLMALSDRKLSALRNEKIGFIPQGYSILSNLTVLDNVLLPYFLHRRRGDAGDRALALLKELGIAHLANAYPKQLSGGELRRVAIARAFINNPKLLLADEPTNDLDTESARYVMSLFSRAADEGMAVLLVTHDPDVIAYGYRIYQMRDGRLF